MVRTRGRFAPVIMGVTLLAAACGGSDDGGSTTADTVDQGINEGIKSALGSTSTTAPAKPYPASLDEWRERWKEERQAILDRIEENGWGLSADGKTVKGPEGFTIDLSTCPAGWNMTEGLTDSEIKFGQTLPLSGPAAAYGQIKNGMQSHFDAVNASGGIEDVTGKTRRITYIAKDDGYDSARTIPLVDELIDADKVFLVVTLGSPNTMKTYDKLNQRCIPQPMVMTGHPAWGDPLKHPWTTGEQMAYNTEALLWGSFIEQHADELKKNDGKITVGAIVANNDFGKAYEVGFKAWLAQSPIKADVEFVSETHEPTAPTITDAMTTLASKDPEVFISMTFAAFCTQSIVEAAQNGLKDQAMYVFQPSVCKGNTYAGKEKVGGDGMASDGWYMVGGGLKAMEAAAFDNDPWVKEARAQTEKLGVNWKLEATTLRGVSFAWSHEQVLRIASQMKGGLNRANYIVALRSFDMTAPFLLEGAKFNMNGNADSYLTEASEISVYRTAMQGYEIVTDVIDLSGRSKNCAFNQSTGFCE